MRVFLSALVLLLASCAGRDYYHISSEEKWRSYKPNICAGATAIYERTIGEGVRVTVMPRRDKVETTLKIRFELEMGSTVHLHSSDLQIRTAKGTSSKTVSFGEITYSSREEDWVPKRKFAPQEELQGSGRFSNHPQPYLRDDWYDIMVSVDPNPLDWFQVEFPDLSVNGSRIVIKPVTFEYKHGYYAICIQ